MKVIVVVQALDFHAPAEESCQAFPPRRASFDEESLDDAWVPGAGSKRARATRARSSAPVKKPAVEAVGAYRQVRTPTRLRWSGLISPPPLAALGSPTTSRRLRSQVSDCRKSGHVGCSPSTGLRIK